MTVLEKEGGRAERAQLPIRRPLGGRLGHLVPNNQRGDRKALCGFAPSFKSMRKMLSHGDGWSEHNPFLNVCPKCVQISSKEPS